MSDNTKLIAEARQWAKTETHEAMTEAVIRKLADALESAVAERDLWMRRCGEETNAWVEATKEIERLQRESDM